MAFETVDGSLQMSSIRTAGIEPPVIQQSSTVAGCVLLTEKVSVNTGRFIPGIYRVNPYRVSKESCARGGDTFTDVAIEPTGKHVTTLSGDTRVYFGDLAKSKQAAVPNFDYLNLQAIQKAAAKLGESEAGLGESLGELRETLNLLRNPFKDLREFLVHDNLRNLGLYNRIAQYARSGIWGERGGSALSGKRAAQVAANSWLELRYGLLPLIYTVQDLVKLVNKKAMEFDRTKIRSVHASAKSESFIVGLPRNILIGWTFITYSVGTADSVKSRACIQYHLDSPRSMHELLGLSPQFLPELAWELTRLSFVVDWWFSVGDWLGALRGLYLEPTVKVLGNTVGMKVDRKVTVNASTKATSMYPTTPINRGEVGYYAKTHYTRLVNQHLPLLPQFKPDLNSILHTVDGLALLLKPILGMLRR